MMLSPQPSPQPPVQTPPGQQKNGGFISPQQQQNLQNRAQQQGTQQAGQQNVPGSQPFISETQQRNLQNGQLPQGSFGSMYQMPVDGTYQILAYEKFGQVLPGMNTLIVTIRNNMLIFPAEGRLAGKTIQLAFGPANTIMLTPIDNRQDPVRTGNINQGNSNQGNQVNNVGQGNNSIQGGNNTGLIQPTAQSEIGVYVLSNEFFAISVTGRAGNNDFNQGQTSINGQPPVNGQTTINGQFPGGQVTGSEPPAAGRTIPGTLPPIGAGSNLTAQPGAGGTNAVLPGTNRTGANQGQGNTGTTQIPGNGTVQQPLTTTPPGSPNQAVLILRRVSN